MSNVTLHPTTCGCSDPDHGETDPMVLLSIARAQAVMDRAVGR